MYFFRILKSLLTTVPNLYQDATEDPPEYVYEMTSTSFTVSQDGFLVVNEAGLDRDPPNEPKLSFQVWVCLLNFDQMFLT